MTQRVVPDLLRLTGQRRLAETIAYSLAHIDSRLLVADELGFLHVLTEPNVTTRVAAPLHTSRLAHFRLSVTSIFDIEVSQKWNSTCFCASSDGSLVHADIAAESVLRSHKVHSLGIKCVRENPQYPGQLLTASRDGSVAYIDVRENGLRPHWTMPNVHTSGPAVWTKTRRRRNIGAPAAPAQTVSACVWLSDRIVATSGVADGKVKIWDLRMWPHSTSSPIREFFVHERDRVPGSKERSGVGIGISWLDIKAGYLLAACPRAGTVTVYRANDFLCDVWDPQPINTYRNQQHDSFYFRPRFSPDGEFVSVGNPSRVVNVWKVGSDEEPTIFEAHEGEVTMVSWRPGCFGFASTGDDGMIYSWSVVR